MGNPSPFQGSMIRSLGTVTQTSKEVRFLLRLEAVHSGSQHFSNFSTDFTVFGRHTSWFVVWGFESFLVSLKPGLFLRFCFVFFFVVSGRFGVGAGRKGVKLSLLSLTGYVCDVRASKVSPSCALVGTGPHSQISDQTFWLSQVLLICHIRRVSELCRYYLGYQRVEWENCLNAAAPSQNFLPICELKVCVCLPSILSENRGNMSTSAVDGCLLGVWTSHSLTLLLSVSCSEFLKFTGAVPDSEGSDQNQNQDVDNAVFDFSKEVLSYLSTHLSVLTEPVKGGHDVVSLWCFLILINPKVRSLPFTLHE